MSNSRIRHGHILCSWRTNGAALVLAAMIFAAGCGGGSTPPVATPDDAKPVQAPADAGAEKPAAKNTTPPDTASSSPKPVTSTPSAGGAEIPGITDAPRSAIAMGGLGSPDAIVNKLLAGINVLAQQEPQMQFSMEQFRSQSILYTGVDVLTPGNLAKLGLDLSKPMTFAVTELLANNEPGGMVLSVGVANGDALKTVVRKLADKQKVTVTSDTRAEPAVDMIGKEMVFAIADHRAYLMLGDRKSDMPMLLRGFLDQKSRTPLGNDSKMKTAVDGMGGAGDMNAYIDLQTIIAKAATKHPTLADALRSVAMKAGETQSAAYLALDPASALRKAIEPGDSCRDFVAKMDKPLALMTFSLAEPMQLVKLFADAAGSSATLAAGSEHMKAACGMDMAELGDVLKGGAGGIALFKSPGPLPVSIVVFAKLQNADAQKAEKAKAALNYVFQQGLGLPPPIAAQLQPAAVKGYFAIGSAPDQIKLLGTPGPDRWKPHYANKELLGVEYFIADMVAHMQALRGGAPVFNPLAGQTVMNLALLQKNDGVAVMSDSSQASVATISVIAAIAIPSLLRSRMAANETAAMAGCKMFAEAQEIYHRTDYNKDGVLEYAQAIKGDWSLLENKAGAGDIQLVDKSFGDAEGPPSKNPTPKAGYCFKILKGQGAAVPSGKRSFLSGTRMTLGYALLAYPVAYDSTGRSMFMISHSGTIYQKDAGAETEAIAEQMTEFNPDNTWVPSE